MAAGFLLMLFACTPQGMLTKLDLGSIYSPGQRADQIRCRVHHLDDSTTVCRLRFPLNDQSGKLPISYRVSLSVLNNMKESRIEDTLSMLFSDSLSGPGRFFEHSFKVRALSGMDYVLRIEIQNLSSGHTWNLLKPILKQSHSSGSWFSFETLGNLDPWEPWIIIGEPVRIHSADTLATGLFCNAYFHKFSPALPPFTSKSRPPFDYREDTAFILPLHHGKSDYIFLNQQGFYHFRKDTTQQEGFTLFRMPDDYPRVTTPRQMIQSMRYICTQQEYDVLIKSPAPKATLDSFWIALAGNADRAVGLIREYYQRVEQANNLFFSFCEGWKTDRGMIYIIFGPPSSVYRSDHMEIWTYGETNNFRSLQFVFQKVRNPFTVNDFVLQRQENYRPYWFNAVDRWRR